MVKVLAKSLLVTFTVFLLCDANGNTSPRPEIITLFVDYGHQGNKSHLDVSKCSNVSSDFVGKVTAVDTRNYCARLYDNFDCKGNWIEILPRSPAHNYLAAWNDFNDITLSAGPCRDECDESVTGPVPSLQDGIDVTVYSRPMYQGLMETINVKGCTLIPRFFNSWVGSINTTDGKNCFQLYNNVDCEWKEMGQDTIELRHGTPFHNKISHWGIRQVKAISHCSWKCQQKNKDAEKKVASPQPSAKNQVVLFDEPNYKGNSIVLELDNNQCMPLRNHLDWEGAANSVKIMDNEACLLLHTTRTCGDDKNNEHQVLRLETSLSDLATKNFSSIARSINLCDGAASGQTTAQPIT